MSVSKGTYRPKRELSSILDWLYVKYGNITRLSELFLENRYCVDILADKNSASYFSQYNVGACRANLLADITA